MQLNEGLLFQQRPDLMQLFNVSWVSTPAGWGSGPHFPKWTRGSPELVRGQPTAGSLTPSQTSRGRCRILSGSSSGCNAVFETSRQVLPEASTWGVLIPFIWTERGWDNVILSACWGAPLPVLFWAKLWETEILPYFFLESHSLTPSVSHVIKWGSWKPLPLNFLFD